MKAFREEHPDAEQPLKAWLLEAGKAEWRTPQEIKNLYGNASVIANNRIVFNIAGNKHKLAVHFHYQYGIARIKFVGTHAEYDAINVETI